MEYAIFGAGGAVGRELVPVLVAAGKSVRVVGRSPERLRREFSKYGNAVELCEADLSKPDEAAIAAKDVETIVYLVGVPYTQFAMHPKLSRIAVDAAVSSGVRRFVHISTVYPYGKPQHEMVNESHPREPHTFKGRMRKEQEDIVLGADGKNGMRTVVLRPPDFYGPTAELSYVRAIFDAAASGGTANVIGPIDTLHEFIFVPDLAATVFALAEKEEAFGEAWNVAGAGLITTRRFADLVFEARGRRGKLRVANKFILRVLGIFDPFLREVQEMHYLWTSPVALDDGRLRALLPDLSKTPYEEGIRLTLEAMSERPGSAGA